MTEEIKRLFFGIEVTAPWPSDYPKGRMLDESHRHLTLAFLGNMPVTPLQSQLESFPKAAMRVGSVGYFDDCLILPPRHPNVVAWHTHWLEETQSVAQFHHQVNDWLMQHDYPIDKREWNPHVTICRKPFDPLAWKKAFIPLPFYTSSIHLFESVGELHYLPIWSDEIKPPFEEIDHTADMAFIIRAESLFQLYCHAFTALAFKAPEFLNFFNAEYSFNSLDDIIIALNHLVTRVDSVVGSPLKAVSFHGKIVTLPNDLLQWEMIVDV